MNMDEKALATAQDIALMWGHDRSNFVSKIQVAVRDAMRWANWQPIASAPMDGTEILVWFPKVRLDDDDNMTDEVIGGAAVVTSFSGGEWNDPDYLDAHGSNFLEDWCFAATPTHWMPMPGAPS